MYMKAMVIFITVEYTLVYNEIQVISVLVARAIFLESRERTDVKNLKTKY